jgi:hypothetical protein
MMVWRFIFLRDDVVYCGWGGWAVVEGVDFGRDFSVSRVFYYVVG